MTNYKTTNGLRVVVFRAAGLFEPAQQPIQPGLLLASRWGKTTGTNLGNTVNNHLVKTSIPPCSFGFGLGPSAVRGAETVFSEVLELFEGPIHVGMDEVPRGAWSADPVEEVGR